MDFNNILVRFSSKNCAILSKRMTAMFALAVFGIASMGAKSCGMVDYTQHAQALMYAHDWVVHMMLYAYILIQAIAAVLAVISALQIYLKMQLGEQGVFKDILMTFWAILFLFGAAQILPAFYGIRYNPGAL